METTPTISQQGFLTLYVVWDSVPERFYDLWEDPFEFNSLLNGMIDLTPEEQEAFDKLSSLDVTLSIDEKAVDSFSVFPNPVGSKLYLKSNTAVEFIQIFDFSGREVLSSNNSKEIDVSFLHSGVYVIKVGDAVRQFVKL